MLRLRALRHGPLCSFLMGAYITLCLYFAIAVVTWTISIPTSRVMLPNKNQTVQIPEFPNRISGYDQYRAFVRSENTDEFISQILSKVTIVEIDLKQIAHDPTSEFDQEIYDDLEKLDPKLGVDGAKAYLDEKFKDQAAEISQTEGFNRLLSDYIPLNRSVPDLRDHECSNEIYDEVLPTTSVVIIFANEPFSTLIRTVTSVMNRTPENLLSDIILLDDFSTRAHLKGKLERYLATKFPLDKIRLARLNQRVGLIKARMLGGHLATGDVITFIDAHCEVLEHWIEPLLQRIKDDRTVIPCPQMGFIDSETMVISSEILFPSFSWKGDFMWSNLPEDEWNRRPAKHWPIRTPVMVGCMFAIDRKYFWEIGSFDPGMERWGGENLEIGFRVWQCGGSIEVLPCSHVAHIEKYASPYPDKLKEWPKNTARAARVWMDEYQDIFLSFWPELKNATLDVASRQAFRERKQCKSFQWYMENVYPSKFRMQFDSKFYGQIRNKESGYCLDAERAIRFDDYVPPIRPCVDDYQVQQIFFLSNAGSLRREQECAVNRNERIEMISCDEEESKSNTWEYQNEQLVLNGFDLCATLLEDINGTLFLGLEPCDLDNNAQQWVFTGV